MQWKMKIMFDKPLHLIEKIPDHQLHIDSCINLVLIM